MMGSRLWRLSHPETASFARRVNEVGVIGSMQEPDPVMSTEMWQSNLRGRCAPRKNAPVWKRRATNSWSDVPVNYIFRDAWSIPKDRKDHVVRRSASLWKNLPRIQDIVRIEGGLDAPLHVDERLVHDQRHERAALGADAVLAAQRAAQVSDDAVEVA